MELILLQNCNAFKRGEVASSSGNGNPLKNTAHEFSLVIDIF